VAASVEEPYSSGAVRKATTSWCCDLTVFLTFKNRLKDTQLWLLKFKSRQYASNTILFARVSTV
jgi:hypothetical protein